MSVETIKQMAEEALKQRSKVPRSVFGVISVNRERRSLSVELLDISSIPEEYEPCEEGKDIADAYAWMRDASAREPILAKALLALLAFRESAATNEHEGDWGNAMDSLDTALASIRA
jgi:hypothetical protein